MTDEKDVVNWPQGVSISVAIKSSPSRCLQRPADDVHEIRLLQRSLYLPAHVLLCRPRLRSWSVDIVTEASCLTYHVL